jgi:RNA polymerase sigma-70 factor (ECF subfamily)
MSDAEPDHCGFATTRWSLIVAGREPGSPGARQALAHLCDAYWYPLYAYVRRRGHDADEAADLTQEFFARLLEGNFLGGVDPAKGRFRAFLLAACKHFLANEHDRACAQKRGGGRAPLSLDLDGAEGRYRREPAHDLTAEKLYERRWALTLLDRVLGRLREEMAARGKGEQFDRLGVFLLGDRGAPSHGQVAEVLGMTAGAVKVAVHRLRQRYRELIQEEIAHTVQTPDEIDDEIRDLFAFLAP